MIPVTPKPEPSHFDARVRKPGLRWLRQRRLPPGKPVPRGTEIEPYWRGCIEDLHQSYDGVCAYLCIYIERVMGGTSVDHFVAKSKVAGLAYEWANYRLACTTMNARKHDFDTVLDPFTLKKGTFRLELVSGRIYPSPALSVREHRAAQRTIDRLGLDDPGCRELRARRFSDYLELRAGSRPAAQRLLRRDAPFLYQEARRQRLL